MVEVELGEEEDLGEAEDDGGSGWMGHFVSKDTPHLMIAGASVWRTLLMDQSEWSHQRL